MSYRDYYQILGVGRDATAEEVQKSYRSLAKRYHPDVSKEPDAEARFKEIGEAYEVLKDADKRRLYDKWGPQWRAISEGRAPPPGTGREVRYDFGDAASGSNINDLDALFEQVFGGRGTARGRRTRGRTPSSPSVRTPETVLSLGVSAAYRGGTRELSITDPATRERRRLTVNVPAGVRDGQRIRLPATMNGGDLYLRIQVSSDERFRLVGDNVFTTLRISPSEAVLGGTAPLVTLDGKVNLKVPPGSSSGRQIRLKGRGYPASGGVRGDLFAEIAVSVPAEPTDEERDLYEQLARVSRFDPRGEDP
ncbi:MAG: DnaJ C-terminal domain-containing protein [Sandaracinaceae bacterium]